ncbi:MAG: NTP transferase domain-containing protein [Patescibacteria group bacterium]
METRTRVVVLAAGRGTRMRSEIPKVLVPLNGRPMIGYLLDAIKESGADQRPVMVVGDNEYLMRSTLGDGYDYVRQCEQLGTGHAVQCTEPLLKDKTDTVIVLYGDHPFVSADTIANLTALHQREGCVLSMMTTVVEDFNDWRAPFADFSRVLRDAAGHITAVAEAKDATSEQRELREVNPAFFAFQAAWLWEHLALLKNNNAKNEYYLTDLVRIAIGEGQCIASLAIDPAESIGVNTPEHLSFAARIIAGRQTAVQ